MASVKDEAAATAAFALRTLRRFLLLAGTLVGVILASCWLTTLLSFTPREAPAAAIEGPVGTPTPMTSFSMYSVGNTGGVGVYIRRTPRLVDQIRAWADGTLIQQVGPDVEEEGILWHEVRDPDGNIGYVPAAYLLPTGELLPPVGFAMAILVGTCSWADHTNFYPPGTRAGDRIAYYAKQFPVVEIDSTYYYLQPARNFAGWAEKTPDGFVFDVKSYKELTQHDRDVPPRDITYLQFTESIQPLRDAGKLRSILFQFPPWFTARQESRDYLLRVRDWFKDDLVSVEFRNRAWFQKDETERTLEFLREYDFVHVMVDEPQLGTGSVPKVVAVTNPALAVIRFHGRNAETWYKKVERTGERFNYQYSPEELSEWIPDVRALESKAGEIHVMMNNNADFKAIRNARDFLNLLADQPHEEGRQLSFLE